MTWREQRSGTRPALAQRIPPEPDRLEQAARVCDRLAEDVAELAAWLRRQRLTLAGKP